jgi:hypothetical protein
MAYELFQHKYGRRVVIPGNERNQFDVNWMEQQVKTRGMLLEIADSILPNNKTIKPKLEDYV